jgi:hypothetical protein
MVPDEPKNKNILLADKQKMGRKWEAKKRVLDLKPTFKNPWSLGINDKNLRNVFNIYLFLGC